METCEINHITSERAREWVRLLASGDIGTAGLSELKLWLTDPMHAQAFERERAFWQELELHRGLFAAANDAEASAPPPASRQDVRPPSIRPRAPSKRFWAVAIAASLVLAFTGPEMLLRLRADQRTDVGDIRTVALADGSTAVLDSGSAIQIDYRDGERRIALLRGRAWFDVAHGDARPFRVTNAEGVTEDIGTAFEIDSAAPDGTRVAVSQGAVQARASAATPGLILHAGQQARYADGIEQRLGDIRPDRVAAWRTGELLIDRQPLASAIAEIARYRRGETFVLADLAGHTPVSGVFRTDRPDDALAALAASAGLRLTRLPAGTILIR